MNTTQGASTATTSSRTDLLASRPARRIAAVVTFTLLTAIAAKVALPLPGTSVPFTFQTLAIVLAGALLGSRLGASSQILYLTLGMIGVPVFFGPVAGPAYLFGPTGGYLIAAPLAAWVVGRLANGSGFRVFGAMLAGLAVIYAGGVSWLAATSGWSVALSLGLLPFLVADLVKMGMGTLIAGRLRDRSRSLFGV